jgi:hypothetical protein
VRPVNWGLTRGKQTLLPGPYDTAGGDHRARPPSEGDNNLLLRIDGGGDPAVLFSFTSTCQRLSVEARTYLRDVLTRLPSTPAELLGDLLPDRWQSARAAKMAPLPASATQTPTPAAVSAP